MLSNSRSNQGLDVLPVALPVGRRTMRAVFLTTVAAELSSIQYVAWVVSKTLSTSAAFQHHLKNFSETVLETILKWFQELLILALKICLKITRSMTTVLLILFPHRSEERAQQCNKHVKCRIYIARSVGEPQLSVQSKVMIR